jgi:putative transposase
VVLPRLGAIRTHESTRKLARHLERGTAAIKSATVSFRRGRWFVSLTCEITRALRPVECPGSTVGIDLGVKTLAVLSTGEAIANPKPLDTAQVKLRRQSRTVSRRRGPDRRTGQTASKRWQRANARRGRAHHRVANLREDALHKVTSWLSTRYGTIVVEDLNVAGMLRRGGGLARGLGDASMGTFRRLLTYKTGWSEATLSVADRWYPSSKTCSACGAVKAKLPLRVRVFACEACGLRIDRDLNAAINLAQLVERATECVDSTGSGPETGASDPGANGRRDRVSPAPALAVVAEASTLRRYRASGKDLPPHKSRER